VGCRFKGEDEFNSQTVALNFERPPSFSPPVDPFPRLSDPQILTRTIAPNNSHRFSGDELIEGRLMRSINGVCFNPWRPCEPRRAKRWSLFVDRAAPYPFSVITARGRVDCLFRTGPLFGKQRKSADYLTSFEQMVTLSDRSLGKNLISPLRDCGDILTSAGSSARFPSPTVVSTLTGEFFRASSLPTPLACAFPKRLRGAPFALHSPFIWFLEPAKESCKA